jgi:hypothetical protein
VSEMGRGRRSSGSTVCWVRERSSVVGAVRLGSWVRSFGVDSRLGRRSAVLRGGARSAGSERGARSWAPFVWGRGSVRLGSTVCWFRGRDSKRERAASASASGSDFRSVGESTVGNGENFENET